MLKTILDKSNMLLSQIVQVRFGILGQNNIFKETFYAEVWNFKFRFEILFCRI